jgi:hypothetical protein
LQSEQKNFCPLWNAGEESAFAPHSYIIIS